MWWDERRDSLIRGGRRGRCVDASDRGETCTKWNESRGERPDR